MSRDIAQNSASLAMALNRISDFLPWSSSFLLFSFLMSESCFLVFLCVMTKSSISFFGSWLPNAMESPTPVSSLLHSSTMVVASVFLLSFLGVYSPFFGFLSMSYSIYMGLISYFFKDYKRVVAYSTSSQLVLISLFFVLSAFVWTIFYVYVHAFFKASLFIMCGMFIHIVDIQQYGVSSSGLVYTFFVFCLISILGFPFLSVIKLNDEIVLSNVGLIQVSFVFFGVSTFLYCVKMVFYSFSFVSTSLR